MLLTGDGQPREKNDSFRGIHQRAGNGTCDTVFCHSPVDIMPNEDVNLLRRTGACEIRVLYRCVSGKSQVKAQVRLTETEQAPSKRPEPTS